MDDQFQTEGHSGKCGNNRSSLWPGCQI